MTQTSTMFAAATGLCLAQIGEFAFVLGNIGRDSGVVSEAMFSLIVSVTIISFVLTAILVPLAPKFGNFVASLTGGEMNAASGEGALRQAPDVVIIGFGPAGQIAAQPFVDSDKRVFVIDLNREGVRRARQFGFEGLIGDATQNDVLEHARVQQAQAVVITVPHQHSALTILEHVRQLAPHAHVVIRSRYHAHTESFVSAGAHEVIGDEELVGESLAGHLQRWLESPQPNPNRPEGAERG